MTKSCTTFVLQKGPEMKSAPPRDHAIAEHSVVAQPRVAFQTLCSAAEGPRFLMILRVMETHRFPEAPAHASQGPWGQRPTLRRTSGRIH